MGFVRNLVGGITGSTAANAARDSAEIQANAGEQAIEQIKNSKSSLTSCKTTRYFKWGWIMQIL
jgi:putative IMPACT (imprinted ancient) family translation regulator